MRSRRRHPILLQLALSLLLFHAALSDMAGNLFYWRIPCLILPFQLSHVSYLFEVGTFPVLFLACTALLAVPVGGGQFVRKGRLSVRDVRRYMIYFS